MKKNIKTLIALLFFAAFFKVAAQDSTLKIPAEIQPFVGQNSSAIALESADLNGDGTKDYILVTEKATATATYGDGTDDERTLLILTSGADGKLKLAQTNKQVVYCKSCGGVFGDPFASAEAKRNSFTVNNYGGSAWRWSESYQFNYSRTDKTWQLVRMESESFHTSDPNKVKTKILTPKNFGKINISDFDPEKIK